MKKKKEIDDDEDSIINRVEDEKAHKVLIYCVRILRTLDIII